MSSIYGNGNTLRMDMWHDQGGSVSGWQRQHETPACWTCRSHGFSMLAEGAFTHCLLLTVPSPLTKLTLKPTRTLQRQELRPVCESPQSPLVERKTVGRRNRKETMISGMNKFKKQIHADSILKNIL